MTLYELTHEYQEAFRTLSDNDVFDEDTIKDTLDGLKYKVEEKCLSVAAYIKNCQADADAMKDYEQHMNKKRKVMENKIASLKVYVQHHMETNECSDIKGTEISLRVCVGPEALVIDDEGLAIDSFPLIKTSVDKVALKKYCQDDPTVSVGYAHLDRRSYLKIT